MTPTVMATPGAALAEQSRLRGAADALVFPQSGGRLTFAAWDAAATGLARGLISLGLRPGDHLALLAENRLEWPVVQIATALAGLVFVPLNTHYRQDDLGFALRQSRSRGLVLSQAFRSNRYAEMVAAMRPSLPDLRHLVFLDDPAGQGVSYDSLLHADAVLPEIAGDDIAALLYTSGTTGSPKGALLTHRAMLGNSAQTAARLGLRAGDRWTSIIPLFHCAGCIMNLLGSLQSGAAYVGLPAFDPVLMFQTIQAERCTALSGVPTSYLAMLDHPQRAEFDLSSLRTGTCGGADTDPALLRACAAAFPQPGLVQVYGQTESGTLVSCPAPDDPLRWETAGLPLPDHAVRITDPESGAPLPPGAVGQIEARGPLVMQGYYDNPEGTAEALDAEGWLRTGDLGRLRPDGRLELAGGRLKDMIIRGGENIYPVEVEALLMTHPAVAEVAVFAVPDTFYGEAVAAAVRLRAPARAEDLAAFCAGRLARFKIPSRFFHVTEFPLTASSKIRKTILRETADSLPPLA